MSNTVSTVSLRALNLKITACLLVVLACPLAVQAAQLNAATVAMPSDADRSTAPKTVGMAPVETSDSVQGQSQSQSPTSIEVLPPGADRKTPLLTGTITHNSIRAELGKLLADLLTDSLATNNAYKDLAVEQAKKHRLRKVASKIGNVLGEVVTVNASAASKDGAKIALEETSDWDDKDSLNYEQQRVIDKLHPKIAGALLQVAMGRGNASAGSGGSDLAKRGLSELSSLVGDGSVAKLNTAMDRWQLEAESSRQNSAPPCDLISSQKKVALLTEAAVQDDPTLIEIRAELEKMARPNKMKDRVSSTLQTALDTTAYMMPHASLAAAVELIKGLVVVSSGGPEEDKLQHLLILIKRNASRRAALNEELQVAMQARQIGAQTNNKLLTKCADAVIESLVTPQTLIAVTKLANAPPKTADDDDD